MVAPSSAPAARSFAVAIVSALALSACGAVPDGRGGQEQARSDRSGPASTPNPVPKSRSAKLCLANLGETGSRFTVLPDRNYGSGCQRENSVLLSALQGDRSQFAISNIGAVECETARLFSAWARFGVDRAARQILGSPLDRIETMGSYSCRNIAGTGRRSAHSRAEAIDIAAFVLEDGRRISVLSDWSAGDRREREFLRTVHRSACKRFGTVLGPDYNTAHRDHLHLEEGDGSFCR
ncbi:MAG: extensin family protein [Erythrobacter sp.]